MTLDELVVFEKQFLSFITKQGHADSAHDVSHITRVVKVAKAMAQEERAELAIVVPAAWLHDCVSFPKSHPDRKKASTLAGDKAITFLESIGYPQVCFDAIHHAISAHSFSANIAPTTLEAKIVQDADRLDALGAVGVARCMLVSGSVHRSLYSIDDPFCDSRPVDDKQFSIDHFYSKLFNIAETLHTDSARIEGRKREAFMRDFLAQLKQEI